MGLEEEFDAYSQTYQQKNAFELEQKFDAFLKDRAQGGSIRATPLEQVEENPPIGSVVGGVAAGVTAAALTHNPVVTAIVAGLGAAGGQFVQGKIEQAVGDKKAPRDFNDELYRMQREGSINLMFEGAGQGVAWLVPKIRSIAPYAGSVTQEARMAQQNMERMTGVHNPFFMPAEMTSSRVLDILQNISEYSLLGGGAIEEFKRDRDVFYTNMARSILNRYGAHMSADDVGRAVVDSAKYNLEMGKHQSKFLYDAIESQASPQFAKAPAKLQVKKETAKAKPEGGPSEGEAFGESLADFLRSKGGIKDQGGEIKRLEMKSQAKPGQKGLVKDDGMDLDTAAEAAVEAGYLQDRDINKLIDALESESRGKPVYSASKGNTAFQDDIYEQEFNAQFETKTVWQDIQVGEQLVRMRVLVAEQENQLGGTRIDLRPIKEAFKDIARTSKEAGGLADMPMGNTMMSWLASKADFVSYPVAKAMRTEIRTLKDVLSKTPETKNAPGIGKATKLYNAMTNQIRAGLADDDPFLAQMWDEANFIEAGANRQFNTKFINELVKLADEKGGNVPEAVVSKVWNENKVTPLKTVRNAVSPENWRKMQQVQMERMLTEAMPGGVPDSQKFQQAFFGTNGEKLDMMEAGFDKATVTELKQFHQALKVAQEKQHEGTGRVLVQLTQGRYLAETLAAGLALTGLYTEGEDKGLSVMAGMVMLTPAVLGKIFTTPGGIKWITEGLSTSPKTARGIALWTQISKVLQGGVTRTQEVPAGPGSTVNQLQNVQ
jgi:hypothetical protein